MIERRTLIKGLVALVAAPAIVKASSLMVCAPTETLSGYWEYDVLRDKWAWELQRNDLLTIDQITREAVRLFQNSNQFIKDFAEDYEFYKGEQWDAAKVGDVIRIRLPNDFVVSDDNRLRADHTAGAFAYALVGRDSNVFKYKPIVPQIPTPLAVAALAVAAAPVVEQVLQKPVTRRFWK